MTDYICEPLAKHHDRTTFACGNAELDAWLKQLAKQDQDRHVAAVFVLSPRSMPATIAGYYALSATAVALCDLPSSFAKKLPKYPLIPATLLGRLARDVNFPGVGERLLVDALHRSWKNSLEVGSAVVVVDAKDDRATEFYIAHGFEPITRTPQRLVLPIRMIESMFKR